ncbi:bifunctional copper resistance protein CopD/cytochrome c oxidase assembly protein [Cryobacterium sp. 1639]|uniref:cytochrome c oxidase assembly protein n=1 Tax=Cryobacterium inferilacus TaxID=2866629 RepID=UPI001C730A81|nr:cytochrome c oxidase assembly protein [Cryobacterium sp. 1639]MBX0300552.1 bifunctional copper resistance protein CopD/cytochrome c oxidase assembly protein [Cryobacterium sp. 1639]
MVPRYVRIIGPPALLLAAILATVAGLAYGGGADAQLLADPGAVVRWGLPIAKLLVNIGAAGTIGALVLTCFALSPREREYGMAIDFAAASAAFLTVASAITGFLTFLQVTNATISFNDQFSATVGQFFSQIEIGQAWLTTTLIAAAVTVLCFAVRNQTALVFVTLLALLALLPMAQQGHSAGAEGHDAAITALGLHLVFAAVWLGGLLTIILLHRHLSPSRLREVVGRYSTVALVSFVVVAASGYVSAELRVGSWDNLLTGYGVLVLAKVAVLLVLGGFGVLQRRYLIGRMRTTTGTVDPWFWWLVVGEITFMGIASGVAAALARTATPVDEVVTTAIPAATPAQILTGEVLPPELTFARYFTEWNFDLAWVLFCAFGIFFYLAGVVRLRRRGDSWPLHRTILWVVGLITLFYITNGGVNVYEKYLFSTHMLAHMALTMLVPVLLVPGAPVTLAARAIRMRRDGSRGPREWILLAVHSKYAGVISNPIVAAVLFAGSLWVFYYTSLFSWATTDHIGHQWMIVHFLITGYLFVQSLIGIDPVPYRLPYTFRLLLLLGTMAFHAFFGLALMTGTGLLLADWYGAMGRDWGVSALADQQAGGGIAWSVGEIPTIALAIIVAIQWGRSDEKETKRRDRNADRTGDAELNDYNDRLARLASHDR